MGPRAGTQLLPLSKSRKLGAHIIIMPSNSNSRLLYMAAQSGVEGASPCVRDRKKEKPCRSTTSTEVNKVCRIGRPT